MGIIWDYIGNETEFCRRQPLQTGKLWELCGNSQGKNFAENDHEKERKKPEKFPAEKQDLNGPKYSKMRQQKAGLAGDIQG